MDRTPFLSEISRRVWETKYRFVEGGTPRDLRIEDTWRRVARALASVERDPRRWEERFFSLLEDFRFLPGGRILAGTGTGRAVTLFNCFVMGVIEDSMDGIFEALKEGALTMQQGGGVGYDFSTLRPRGAPAHSVGSIASGPVSFMRIWDSMCATLLSTGARRGAMMATLRCDHPDVEIFTEAKRDPRELRHFNLSVLVSDELMEAVRAGVTWPLVFPAVETAGGAGDGGGAAGGGVIHRRWSGADREVPCRVFRRVRARELWERIMRATYDCAEPGVLFIDRINRDNNLWYREAISATNPCGEIPLPPHGACNLGSLNLMRFVEEPFSPRARLNLEALEEAAAVATRMLDNVTDVSLFPLEAQREQARGTRRIGLGITGLADVLIQLGLPYGEERARRFAATVMERICHAAYRASVDLAREKGPFPHLDRRRHLEGPFIRSLPEDIQEGIAAAGIRNSHLTAIAPTGTISLLANNVSSGIEPVFELEHRRRLLEANGSYSEHDLENASWRQWRALHGSSRPPAAFVTARELPPEAHLRMQAAVQPYVDNAISKTINVPEDIDFDAFRGVYEQAFDLGLKGCTTFRPNPVTGAVLSSGEEPREALAAPHCCSIEREAD